MSPELKCLKNGVSPSGVSLFQLIKCKTSRTTPAELRDFSSPQRRFKLRGVKRAENFHHRPPGLIFHANEERIRDRRRHRDYNDHCLRRERWKLYTVPARFQSN